MDNPDPQKPHPKQQAEIPQLNSLASMQSFASMNQEEPSQKMDIEEEEVEELQVVHSKVDKGINRQEIMRMFNEQLEKEEKEREEIQKRRMEMRQKNKEAPKITSKRSQLEQKKQSKEQALQQALTQKFLRLSKRIEACCRKYKTMFRPSMYDTKLNRYRFECKQKFFRNICLGIQQIREMEVSEQSEAERNILSQDPYAVVKRLATIIDAYLVRTLNKGDRIDISRQYKSQWETFLLNIKDQSNLELKRKVLLGTFEPSKIAVASEIDFFTSAKRERLLEKQKQYIAQFTVETAMVVNPMEAENEVFMEKPKAEEEVQPHVEQPAPKVNRSRYANNYIEESSITQLQQLLGEGQLSKMLRRLEEDIHGKSKDYLLGNFKELFSL